MEKLTVLIDYILQLSDLKLLLHKDLINILKIIKKKLYCQDIDSLLIFFFSK